jgi:medium-chain acyl-[acyl-carrier-protein] hydrolase
MTPWLWIPQPRPAARVRLYCLAHAGAGATSFAKWAAAAPEDIEIAAVQLPGREHRIDERPFRRIEAAARELARAIATESGMPFALFGHSAGGRLAVHIAARLAHASHPPVRVFVSATPSPRHAIPPIHELGDDDFIEAISSRFGGLPAQIRSSPELWAAFEKPLRADLEMLSTDPAMPRLGTVPVTLISGDRDQGVDGDMMAGWSDWCGESVAETVAADHFSYRTEPEPYIRLISRQLAATLERK